MTPTNPVIAPKPRLYTGGKFGVFVVGMSLFLAVMMILGPLGKLSRSATVFAATGNTILALAGCFSRESRLRWALIGAGLALFFGGLSLVLLR